MTRSILRALRKAQTKVTAEIDGFAAGGDKFTRGLANEGWAGGYRQALYDVEAMLTHGYPSDPRHYWRQ